MKGPEQQEQVGPAAQPGTSAGHANSLNFPPINSQSSLLAAQPSPALDGSASAQPGEDVFASYMDTHDLYAALTRSQQVSGAGGMRRATSAPHSMDLVALLEEEQQRQPPLSPTGGPMRRVASSLGMRRSNSFLWTPAAHHDFERAIGYLNARGTDASAAAIVQLMRQRHADLKVQDVDKHLRKKFLVQRRIMQQLAAPIIEQGAADGARLRAGADEGGAESSAARSPRFGGGLPTGGMAAVAEEPLVSAPSSGQSMPCTSVELSEQLQRQQAAHRQLESMREQMQASAQQA